MERKQKPCYTVENYAKERDSMQSTELEKNTTNLAFNGTFAENGAKQHDDVLLMCKDTPVYNISNGAVLNEPLLPGAIRHGTLNKCEEVLESEKLPQSQRALTERRVDALKIALTLIEKEQTEHNKF